MLPYFISSVITGLVLVSRWLYGNKKLAGPILSLLTQLMWIAYEIWQCQYALLIPAVLIFVIEMRNAWLWMKSRRNEHSPDTLNNKDENACTKGECSKGNNQLSQEGRQGN